MASLESDCLLPVVDLSTLFTSSRADTGQEHLEASEGKMAIVGHLPTVIVRSAESVAYAQIRSSGQTAMGARKL